MTPATQATEASEPPEAPPLTIGHAGLLRDGADREFRRFVHGLLAFTARLHAARNGLAELIGLSGAQYTILISIAHLERAGDVNITTLADHLHISGAFVTIETGRLARKGLVRKEASRRDRRRVRLGVTDEGRRLLSRLAPTQSRVNDLLFAPLTGRDLDRMLELLPGLIEGGDEASALLDYETGRRGWGKAAAE